MGQKYRYYDSNEFGNGGKVDPSRTLSLLKSSGKYLDGIGSSAGSATLD
jgi:hypothetical protein